MNANTPESAPEVATPAKVDESKLARTTPTLDAKVIFEEADKRLEPLRRRVDEISRERDMWKLRAEKAEASADPKRIEKLTRDRDGAIAQLADLQRELALRAKDHQKLLDDSTGDLRRADAAERQAELLRGNLEQMQAARDAAIERARVAGEASAKSAINAAAAKEMLGRAEAMLTMIRAAIAPGQNVYKAIERVAQLLGVDRGPSGATPSTREAK